MTHLSRSKKLTQVSVVVLKSSKFSSGSSVMLEAVFHVSTTGCSYERESGSPESSWVLTEGSAACRSFPFTGTAQVRLWISLIDKCS